MKTLVLIALIATGCTPSPLWQTASARLGVRANSRHLHLADADRSSDNDVDTYTFCRDEGRTVFGDRTFSGACVTLICPHGDDGPRCK